MDSINYKNLYQIQDLVLDLVFSQSSMFYLTGGTCLSRFYCEKRYSDDLDLFSLDTNLFNSEVKDLKVKLNDKFELVEEVSSKDFIRYKINNILQVDFVNDRVFRYDKPIVLENGYVIDNIKNILANKITAIVSRDNPKDVFDVYLIDKYYTFKWSEILDIAHKKASFDNQDLIVRLKTFPHFLLKSIKLVDKSFLDKFDHEYFKLVSTIEKNVFNII